MERKAWGFASFAERTVSRDCRQSTWADLQILDVAYLGEFFRQILECFWIFWKDGCETFDWFNLDGPTIFIKFKTIGKEIQIGAAVYF